VPIDAKVIETRSWLPVYLGLAFAWGSSFLLIEIALQEYSPIQISFSRSTIGAITLIIYLKIKKYSFPKYPSLYFKLFILSILLNTGPSLFFAYAQTEVSSILAGIINAITPILTTLISVLIFRIERVNFIQVLGIITGFIGVVVVISDSNKLGESSLLPMLSLFGAVLCFAISYPFIKILIEPYGANSITLASIQLSMSALTQVPFTTMSNLKLQIFPVASLIILGIFATGFAYVWNFELVKKIGGTLTSTISYVIPIIALALGLIFAKEEIKWNQIIGGIVILIGLRVSRVKSI